MNLVGEVGAMCENTTVVLTARHVPLVLAGDLTRLCGPYTGTTLNAADDRAVPHVSLGGLDVGEVID